MKVAVAERQFICPVCDTKSEDKKVADACLLGHESGYQRKSPKYQIGSKVVTRRFNELDYDEQVTTIVKIKGKFLKLELLVESSSGERWWVPAVSYQTIDFKRDPAPFRFVRFA